MCIFRIICLEDLIIQSRVKKKLFGIKTKLVVDDIYVYMLDKYSFFFFKPNFIQ